MRGLRGIPIRRYREGDRPRSSRAARNTEAILETEPTLGTFETRKEGLGLTPQRVACDSRRAILPTCARGSGSSSRTCHRRGAEGFHPREIEDPLKHDRSARPYARAASTWTTR
jgi:hypothetical protein